MLRIPPLGDKEGVMHYHIRWSNSKADWQAFGSRTKANASVRQLARSGESYAVEKFEGKVGGACTHGVLPANENAKRKHKMRDDEEGIHYHIRWSDSSNSRVDWQAFSSPAEANAAAERLALPGETFTVEGFDASCSQCAQLNTLRGNDNANE